MRYGSDYENEDMYGTEQGTRFGMLGFFTGMVAGAALGILFAPKSGRETRHDISEASGQAKEKLDDLIENGREEWSRLRGKATDLATMTRSEVNDFIHFLFNEGKNLKSRVKNDVRESARRTGTQASTMADDVRRGV